MDTGVLEITDEDDAEKTLRLVIPSLDQKDRKGRMNIVTITWIHPDYNAQFCHFYHETPGDLPNFYVNEECDGVALDEPGQCIACLGRAHFGHYLEDAAAKFQVQGLDLDWVCAAPSPCRRGLTEP